MSSTVEIENRLHRIELRNQKVESDKAWETSYSRKIVLAIFTFLVIGSYMNYLRVEKPWLNAFIPTTGFLISTLSLPFFKEMWRKHIYQRD